MKIFLLFAVCVAVVCFSSISAYTMTGFRTMTRSNVGSMQMKGKGRRVPIDQRGEYLKQQRMMDAKKQIDANKPEGVPVFKIFVRPKAGGLWVPCGDLAGDQRATALVNAWLSGFMSDMYKSQLDKGVAKSIFSQEDQFTKSLIENYKPFKKFTKDDIEFGYKVEFDGVDEKYGDQKVLVLEKGMEKGLIDNVREGLGGLFGGN